MSNKKFQTADLFLTNRGANSYTSPFGDIKENILDSHLIQSDTAPNLTTYPDLTVGTIWVNTGTVPPTINIWNGTSWEELSGTEPVVDPDPTDVSFSSPVQGSGTQTDPYILSATTSYIVGGTVESNEEITILTQATATFFAIQTLSGGLSFNQPYGLTDSTGSWTGRLTYTDTVQDSAGTTYPAEFKIGESSVYINWSVIQIANQTEIFGGDGTTVAPNASPRDVDDNAESLYGTGTGTWADGSGTLRVVDSGLNDTYNTSIVFGVNGAMDATDKAIVDGDTITVAFVEADVNAASNGDTISGALTNDDGYFQVFSFVKDGLATALAFDDLVDQAFSTEVESNTVHGSGHNVPAQIDLTANTLTGVEVSIAGAAYTSTFPATVNPGDSIQVKGTTGSDESTAYTANFSYGGGTTEWSVTTVEVEREIVQPSITSPVDGASDLTPEITLISSDYTPGDALNPPGPHTASTWEIYESSGSGPKSPAIVAYEPDWRVSHDDCTVTVSQLVFQGAATPAESVQTYLDAHATTGSVNKGQWMLHKVPWRFRFSNVAAGGIWYIGLWGGADRNQHEWRYSGLNNVVINPYRTGHSGTGTNHHAAPWTWQSTNAGPSDFQEWCNTAIEFQNDGAASFDLQIWNYSQDKDYGQGYMVLAFSPWKGKVPRLILENMDFVENKTHYAPSVIRQSGGSGPATGKVAWRPSNYWKDDHTWLLLENGSVTGTWEAGASIEDTDGNVVFEPPTTEPPDPNKFTPVSVPASQITQVENPSNGGSSKVVLTRDDLNESKAYYSRVKYADDSSTGSLVESEFSPYNEFVTSDVFIPNVGEPFGGGYYVGQFNEGGTIYNLIIAPKTSDGLEGATYKGSGVYRIYNSIPANASVGIQPTQDIADDPNGSQGASWWCIYDPAGPNAGAYDPTNSTGTGIGGFNDWYIPAVNELNILFFFFKPYAPDNVNAEGNGSNPNSVSPYTPNTAFTTGFPETQTKAELFIEGRSEAFPRDWVQSSTVLWHNNSQLFTHAVNFQNGKLDYIQQNDNKQARAIRREPA